MTLSKAPISSPSTVSEDWFGLNSTWWKQNDVTVCEPDKLVYKCNLFLCYTAKNLKLQDTCLAEEKIKNYPIILFFFLFMVHK